MELIRGPQGGSVAIRVRPADENVLRALRNMSESGARRAMSIALNKAIDKAYTAGKRAIAKKRNIKISAAGDAIDKVHTNRNATIMTAMLVASGEGIPVMAVQGTKTQTQQGVTAIIEQGAEPHLFEHCFIARMPTGHVGVFERYTKDGEQSRREIRHIHGKRQTTELPIREKVLPGVATTMVQDTIVEVMDTVAIPTYQAELERQLALEWARKDTIPGLDTINAGLDALDL